MKKVAVIDSFAFPLQKEYKELNRVDLCYEVVKGLIKKVGLPVKEIDLLISSGSDFLDGRGISTSFIIDAMAGQLKEESKVEADGLFSAYYAGLRLETGKFNYALVVSYCKSSESPSFFQSISNLDPFFSRPLAITEFSAGALQASSYINKTGLLEEEIAEIVIKNYENGMKNPLLKNAIYELPSLDKIQTEPYVIEPLKKWDISPSMDGGCAVLLSSIERAKEFSNNPIRIIGGSIAVSPFHLGFREISKIQSAETAFKKATHDLQIDKIDIFEIDYHVSVQELMLCEAFGIAREYEGRDIIYSEELFKRINPSGGSLCGRPSIATGLYRLHHCLEMMKTSDSIRTCVAHSSMGMGLQTNCVLLLSK